MKKILAISLIFVSATVFAQQAQQQGTGASSSSGSTSTAVSQGSSQGQTQSIGCLVNCASTDQGVKDRALADKEIAVINAGTSRDIAEINARALVDATRSTQTIKNTPSVNGSPLVSSNDTCMGSASGSVNAPGFGLSVGKTYTDANCVMLKNSRELWNMGMKAAALALMCTDAANREALELTGFECPQTTRNKADSQKQAHAEQAQYTDPYVRMRMGLAPLAPTAKN